MKHLHRIAGAVAVALSAGAFAAPREPMAPDTVVLENGREKVTVQDFDAAMTRFPEGLREEARAYPNVVIKNLDALFVNRIAADRAKDLGLDKDPLVQRRLQQLQEAYLAERYTDYLSQHAKVPDLTLRAEEIYKVDPKRWIEPATAHVDDIIVNLVGRTPEMALARAKEAEQRLRAGGDFEAVGREYSDDKNFYRNKGDLGDVKVKDLEEPLRAAVERLKPGEISEPVKSGPAYHILRVREKRPERQRSFADVKQLIVGEEDARLRKKAVDDFLDQVRNTKDNIIYKDRVEGLRSDFDISKLDPARAQQIERQQAITEPQTR